MDAHDHMPVQTETVSSYYDQQGNIVKKVTTTVENYEVGTKKIHLDNSDNTLDNEPNKPNKPNEPNKPNKPPSKHKKIKAPMRAVDVSTTMVPSWSIAVQDDAASSLPSSTALVLPSLSKSLTALPSASVSSSAHPHVGFLHLCCIVVAIVLCDGPPQVQEGRGLAPRRPRASPALVHPRIALRPVRLI